MKIRKEIEINFELTYYLKQTIKELEEIYKKAEAIKDKTSEEYQNLEGEFYGYTQELEVFVLGALRSGKIKEENGELLLYKYQPFDWGK